MREVCTRRILFETEKDEVTIRSSAAEYLT